MKVRAIKFGFYLRKRRPGDEFEFQGKPSGKWMEPVDDAARKAFKEAGIKVAAPPPAPKTEADEASAPKTDAGTKGGKKDAGGGKSTGDRDVI